MPEHNYLFTSQRLGFRSWTHDDLDQFAAMNADEEVMKHFPKPLSREESAEFLDRLFKHYAKHGYCYFAAEVLESREFIGFIGLAFQSYAAPFTPATDIGWRLKRSAWGKGYATEGAKRCLQFAFEDLQLEKVISTCPKQNHRSELVMQKIGMKKASEFDHPKLQDSPELQKCVVYEIEKE
ncbi:Protein N-acetyltransferase, RimJ/RimL family [Salinimicrobium catena]|uniref:Protein N-acetyltransferase, RimJ/RimL family n=1 Tax=Salinimicrobium catena TaxID=390640 RepID=A0A1H5P940_9FLAO|nr:GNAT family N-acetyltransferase [Salinimicrobium catena]SDL70451.1 Protein N-acetyltransferase, RimJ/RimL family [Salinimicrobium catena]SEF09507.1 Protein N-acetyltransferase, RimJ/RimL family [Salinimicrobium catena]